MSGHPIDYLEPSASALWARLIEKNGAESISEIQELSLAAISIALSAKRIADAIDGQGAIGSVLSWLAEIASASNTAARR
jgi:hypothetical protein